MVNCRSAKGAFFWRPDFQYDFLKQSKSSRPISCCQMWQVITGFILSSRTGTGERGGGEVRYSHYGPLQSMLHRHGDSLTPAWELNFFVIFFHQGNTTRHSLSDICVHTPGEQFKITSFLSSLVSGERITLIAGSLNWYYWITGVI